MAWWTGTTWTRLCPLTAADASCHLCQSKHLPQMLAAAGAKMVIRHNRFLQAWYPEAKPFNSRTYCINGNPARSEEEAIALAIGWLFQQHEEAMVKRAKSVATPSRSSSCHCFCYACPAMPCLPPSSSLAVPSRSSSLIGNACPAMPLRPFSSPSSLEGQGRECKRTRRQ